MPEIPQNTDGIRATCLYGPLNMKRWFTHEMMGLVYVDPLTSTLWWYDYTGHSFQCRDVVGEPIDPNNVTDDLPYGVDTTGYEIVVNPLAQPVPR